MRVVKYSVRNGKEGQAIDRGLNELTGSAAGDASYYVSPDSSTATHLISRPRQNRKELSVGLQRVRARIAIEDGANLDLLVRQQSQDNNVLHYENGSWIDSYLRSRLYKATLSEATDNSWMNDGELSKSLAGKVFEDVAYGLLSQTNNESGIILSHELTINLMEMFYPEAKRKKRGFGRDGIIIKDGGVSVSDGVCITTADGRASKIMSELEYKTAVTWGRICRQYETFLDRRRQLPNLYDPNAVFVVVLPCDLREEIHRIEEVGRKDFRVLAAPVTRVDVGRLVDYIKGDISSIKP
jgi:hypothetical protein